MNIALITVEYVVDRSGAGGLANYTHRIAIALKQTGHKAVVIYCPWIKEYPENKVIEHEGISIHIAKPAFHPLFLLVTLCALFLRPLDLILRKFGLERYATSSEFFTQLVRYLMFSYGARKKAGELRETMGLDVCQYTNLFGLGILADKRSLISCRLSSHPDLWAPFGMPTSQAERLLQNIAIRRANMLIAPSNYVGKYVKQLYRKPVSIIPSPFLYRKVNCPLPCQQSDNGYGLYFGTLAEWKGIRYLVNALKIVFHQHPEFIFYFAGRDLGQIDTTPPSEYIRKELAGYLNNIKLLDNQDQDSLHTLIKNSMFCCFPTLADNFPNVVLDAMSAEKCIISTYGRGVDEQIINGESGILVAPESEHELSDAILKVIHMPAEERRQYGRKARERLEQFSPHACASQLVETYRQYLLD